MSTTYPPAEYLNQCVTYNPETGEFFWKERPKSHFKSQQTWAMFCTKQAGKAVKMKRYIQNGFPKSLTFRVKWGGKCPLLAAHRVAFILMGVAIPDGMQVDHKDCNRYNNAWSNLRLATQSQNLGNQKVHSRRKHKLPKGVYISDKGGFKSQIRHMGKVYFLGKFTDPQAANNAYAAKAQELYGEFARSN